LKSLKNKIKSPKKKIKKNNQVIVRSYIFAASFHHSMDKKRKIVDYSNVPENILNMLGELYPNGYDKDIIKFPNAKGELISAIRVETDDTIYLIKVSSQLKQMFDDLDIEELDFSNEEKDEISDDDEEDQFSKDKPTDDYED
jgi:DNA-directed RNA polymerase subunit delta